MASSGRTTDTPALLITVRDPGPAVLIGCVLPELARSFRIFVLCGRSASVPSADQEAVTWVDEHDDVDAVCRQALQGTTPDVVLRTTPAYGRGVDEAIVGAVRGSSMPVPIYCLQDHYGLGRELEGVTRLGVMDRLALDCVPAAMSPRTDVLGWLAHERFLSGTPWSHARKTARRKLALSSSDRAVCYFGICSDDPQADEVDLFRFIDCAAELGQIVRWCFRPHPRTKADHAARGAAAMASAGIRVLDGSPLKGEREWLAAFDLLVSPASVMLVDALAFYLAATDHETVSRDEGLPLCMYLVTPESCSAMRAASGLDQFPTHRPGHGFTLAGRDDLGSTLRSALTDPDLAKRHMAEAVAFFKPRGDGARRVREWLEGALVH